MVYELEVGKYPYNSPYDNKVLLKERYDTMEQARKVAYRIVKNSPDKVVCFYGPKGYMGYVSHSNGHVCYTTKSSSTYRLLANGKKIA